MDCDDAAEKIYTYLDGELTPWKRAAIAKHLDECPPCAKGFDFEFELRQVIASKCGEEAPYELRVRIATAIGIPIPPPPVVADSADA
jgi:mycothiol system anti-sigma-R factor